MRLAAFLLVAAVALPAAPTLARSTYPAQLDAACKAQLRTPPNPAALARMNTGRVGDCALCHNINPVTGIASGGNVGPNGQAYKRGSLDPFCILAPVNQPPVLAPIGNQMVNVGQPVGLLLSATDVDGDPLAFSATGLPNGSVYMDAGNGMATFNWTPTQAGNTAITFIVSDGMATDSERVVITAGTVNAPPVLSPIGAQSVLVGQSLMLTVMATDPEGGPVALTATGLPAGATFQDFGDGSADLVFTPTMALVANVTVHATDAGTPPETAMETFTLTAVDPMADTGPVLEYALWNGWDGELTVKGDNAPPDTLVTIIDPTTGAALAVDGASSSGGFGLTARTFLAPCSVQAKNADGLVGDAVPVMSAPLDCGKVLQTRAKPRWRCKDGLLSVRGSAAPVSSAISVIDAATNAMLISGQSDDRGRFRLTTTTGSHANIRVRMSSGTGGWTLGPVPVDGAGLICEQKKPKDD